MRSLQQAEAVTVVEIRSALELREAVEAGVSHIEIHAHLDLTSQDFTEHAESEIILGEINDDTVKSIRVRRSSGILGFCSSGSRAFAVSKHRNH